MQNLISLADAPVTGTSVLPRQKSAGLAWLLSMVVPGSGHLYAGRFLRAGLVFGFSTLALFAVALSIASPGSGTGSTVGIAMLALPALWVFGFLDAYMTVGETNRGIDPSLVDNPRVAAVLNFLTNGFGYFYLGARTKGIAVFVALGAVSLIASRLSNPLGAVIPALTLAVQVWISIDAYRAGNRSLQAQIAAMELPPPPQPSRLPFVVPLVVAGATAFGFGLLVVAGLVALAMGLPSR